MCDSPVVQLAPGEMVQAWVALHDIDPNVEVRDYPFVAVFGAIGVPTPIPPPAGMVSWWSGDGNAQDIVDGNHGTLTGDATFAPGMVGQAFSLDGTGDFVVVPPSANLNITSDISIDAWVNPDSASLSGFKAIVTKEGPDVSGIITGTVLNLNNGRPEHAVETNAGLVVCTSPSTVPAGVFSHLAGTYDGSSIKVYVDGTLVKTCPHSGLMTTNSLPLSIGARVNSNDRFFKGLIDEVEIFNRALTAAEVKAIYDAGSAGKLKPTPRRPLAW